MAKASEKKTELNTAKPALAKFKELANAYSSLTGAQAYASFSSAMSNMAKIQNSRVKAISTLPCDYTKEQLGEFLVNPYYSEKELRGISETLRWSVYSWFKVGKSYADMLTYRYYTIPLYLTKEEAKKDDFKREYRLVDKINKAVNPEKLAHKIAMQCATQGKVFYILRSNVDKVHNKVNYIFAQQLPQDYCTIIGYNNITGYTVSFNLMYFLQIGTDYTQYGDLFEPYMEDFYSVVTEEEPVRKKGTKKFVYASEKVARTKVGGKDFYINISAYNANAAGSPEMFQQNGRWAYYVSLPIDRVWTFEIDDSTPAVITPFSGLMQTFNQQADYEAVQLPIVTNSLLKIFTGEIPYYDANGATTEDTYRLSDPAREMFETLWDILMERHSTGGTAFYTAPVENIKSHDFPESANANDISSSFLKYGMTKTGLQSLVPVNENPHQGQSQYSGYLESRFADRIYRTFESMMNDLYERLGLQYEYKFVMFGSVYGDSGTKSEALKALANGDTTAWYILAALENQSVLDRLSMSAMLDGIEYTKILVPPATSYTQSGNGGATDKVVSGETTAKGGAPTKTETEVQETEREKTETTTVSE